MLVKAFLANGGNYEKSLRQRRWAAIGMLFIGLVGFVCYFLLVPSSGLAEYAQGFYLGAATGITAAALFVVLPLSMVAFKVLMTTTIFYCFVFVVANVWLSKKL